VTTNISGGTLEMQHSRKDAFGLLKSDLDAWIATAQPRAVSISWRSGSSGRARAFSFPRASVTRPGVAVCERGVTDSRHYPNRAYLIRAFASRWNRRHAKQRWSPRVQ
jgi:hypothetical protein